MLKALSKSNRYPVSFGDATFHFRALSGREFRKVEAMQGGKSVGPVYDAIATGIVGWENVVVDEPSAVEALKAAGVQLEPAGDEGRFAVPFDPASLDLILSADDATELFGLMLEGNRPSKAEAGKSGSPAPSAQA